MNLNQLSMKPIKRIVALVATLLATAAMAAPALAGDRKIYSGNTCKAEDGALGLEFVSNATVNKSAATRNVVCPVARDNATGGAAGALKARIYVDSVGISCSFTTTQPTGLGSWASPAVSAVALAAGVAVVDILGIPQLADGAYYITCALPFNDAVLQYEVSE
jgi:hypothetical protein